MNFEIKLPRSTDISIAAVDERTIQLGHALGYMSDAFNFNMADSVTTLEVMPSIATITSIPVTMVYQMAPCLKVGFSDTVMQYPEGGFPLAVALPGIVDITFSARGSGQWSNDSQNSNLIKMDLQWAGQFQVNIKPETVSVWDKIWGNTDDFPDGWKISAPVPNVPLVSEQIAYFLTTNLLFPGQHVFDADPLVNTDGTTLQGFAIPWDAILTGSFKGPPSSSSLNSTTNFLSPARNMNGTSEKLGPKFINEFTSTSDASLFGDIYQALLQDSISEGDVKGFTGDNVMTVLTKHGYESLDPDDYGTLLGLSFSSDMAIQEANTQLDRTSDYTPSSKLEADSLEDRFSILPFGGAYVVTEPSSDINNVLVVDPIMGSITYKKVKNTPTLQSNTKATWLTTGTEAIMYSIVFSSIPNPDVPGAFIVSFSGTAGSNTFSGTKIDPPAPFDVRAWGGTYTVIKPDDHAGAKLYLDRATGAITFAGESVQPSTSPNAAGETRVKWKTSDGTTFDVAFLSTRDTDGSSTVSSFMGYLNNDDFSGTFYIPPSPTPNASTLSNLDKLDISASSIGFFFDVAALIGIGRTLYEFHNRAKNREKKTRGEQQKMDDTVERLKATFNERDTEIKDLPDKFADSVMRLNGSKWQDMRTRAFNDEFTQVVHDELMKISEQERMKNQTADPSDPLFKQVFDKGSSKIRDLAEVFAHDKFGVLMRQTISPWVTMRQIEQPEADATCKEQIDRRN